MILSRRQFGKSFAGGLTLGFLVCGGLWVFHFLNGPSVAGAAMINPNKDDAALTDHPRFLQGIAVEMKYPSAFDLVSRLATDKTAIEQYNLGNSSKRQQTIAVSVHPLETGLVNDSSSWRSRSLDKANYASNDEQLQGERISIMTKADKTEKTLFWVHKKQLLIIAITTNDPNDDITAMLATIKPTIRWRT